MTNASDSGLVGYRRFAWGVLAWNILVVLWGAYVRASGAGAGCGSHWPLCNGDVIPRAPRLETIIEFTHRITSGLALLSVGALAIWAWRRFPSGHKARKYALLAVVFILVEALLGAGLVLLRYVDKNASIGRAFYLAAHLANTQILLAVIALAGWFAGHPPNVGASRPLIVRLALPALLIVSVSGAVAALGDTLFPATSLAEGVRQEMTSTAHILLRLRVFHPLLAIGGAFMAMAAAVAAKRARRMPHVATLAWMTIGLSLLQLVAGGVNVLLLAPVWMQILHLLLADVLWVVLVLLVVEGYRTADANHHRAVSH
jgi:heme a synthase